MVDVRTLTLEQILEREYPQRQTSEVVDELLRRLDEAREQRDRLLAEVENIRKNSRKPRRGRMPSSASDVQSLLIVAASITDTEGESDAK